MSSNIWAFWNYVIIHVRLNSTHIRIRNTKHTSAVPEFYLNLFFTKPKINMRFNATSTKYDRNGRNFDT
jgi:hypothetical protein